MQRGFVLGGKAQLRGKAKLRRNRKITQAVCEFLEQRTLFSTFVVTTAGDDTGMVAPTPSGNVFNAVTLRDAVTAANNAGGVNTISFSQSAFSTPQIITLTNGQLELSTVGGATDIVGPGAGLLTISGGNVSRIFQIDSNVTATVSGLTLSGGNADNTGNFSGGAFLNSGNLFLVNSTLSGNAAMGGGPGIYNYGYVSLTGCTVSGNSGGYCLWNHSGTMLISSSTISGNSGGLDNQGTMSLVNSTVSNNTGNFGVQNKALLSISGSTISGNTGGGIANNNIASAQNVTLTLVNSTISGNSGPGIFTFTPSYAAVVAITDSTINGNSDLYYGGGIYDGGLTSVTLQGSIVFGNFLNGAPGDLAGNAITGDHDLIGVDATSSFTNGEQGNLVGTDPLLGSLANNGGPTQTQALLPGSPAIDAGATYAAANGVDQRGLTRPQGAAPDIGAYEFQTTPSNVLTDSVTTTTFGKPVTFTATVTLTGSTPAGNVTFLDGTATLAVVPVNTSTNTAVFATSALSVGPHNVTAVYTSSNQLPSSSSNTLTETISANATTTALTSSAASVTFGKPVTLTATVTSTGGSPGGSVTFLDGASTLAVVAVNSTTHIASFPTTTLAVGPHSITANYTGATGFSASASSALTETITAFATTTALASSSTSLTFGQGVTLTATVTSTGGTPTGPVTFLSGATTLGLANISSSTHKAILATTALPSGSDSVTAVYSATNGFAASTSAAVKETVTPVATTTTLAASPTSSTFGSSVKLTATVTGQTGSPSGTVTFKSGNTTIGAVTVSTSTHTAVLNITTLPVGTSSITAAYGGATGFSTSTSSALNIVVAGTPSTTKLTVSAASTTAGQPVTLTATVTGKVGTPAGTVTFLDGTKTLGTGTINTSTNQATFTTSALAVGSHTLTASYAASGAFAGSVSTAVTETITPPPTITAVTASVNPTNTGNTVTFTATVTAASGSPTGTVTFLDGTKTLGTASVNSSTHKATFATSTLSIGSHTIKAVYGGATAFNGSSSTTFTETILPPASTTTLVTSNSSVTINSPVTLTATVTSSKGTPTGNVVFLDGTTTIGTVAVNSTTHKAALALTTLPAGPNSITADYVGSTAFAPSVSAVVNETINLIATTTALVASASQAIVLSNITYTATVTSLVGSPGGQVNFMDGNTLLGTAIVNTTTHQAILNTTGTNLGSQQITAVYNGSGVYNFSSSTIVSVNTIQPQVTTTTLSAPSATTDLGQTVALTATVTANAGTPTGSVTFLDNGETIGVASINTSTNQAVLDINTLALGGHDLTAVYDGVTAFVPSTSGDFSELITLDATTTTVSVSPNPQFVNADVTLTATVTSPDGSPDGTVTFIDGSETLGTININTATHQATLDTTALAVGDNFIQAFYNGTSVFAAGNSLIEDAVINPPQATATNLTVGASSTDFGLQVELTATVTADSGSPDGMVTFLDNGETIGAVMINTNTNEAVFDTSSLVPGGHNLTAVYNGDFAFATSSSAQVGELINIDPTTISLATSANSAPTGQGITLTATVTSPDVPPVGSVTFLDGGETIGVVNVNTNTGQAVLTDYTALPIGQQSITAVYGGTDDFETSSSAPVIVNVLPQQSTVTTLSLGAPSTDLGRPVVLTASVTSATFSPDGMVTFLDNGETIGTVNVNSVTDKAVLTKSDFTLGDHDNLTAVYNGDASFSTSSSSPVDEEITLDATTTTLSESSDNTFLNANETLTATVTSPDGGSPDGTVTFLENGNFVLDTVAVNTNTHQAILNTTILRLGDDEIQAIYNGSDVFAGSASVDDLVTVNLPASTVTTLASSSLTRDVGQPVTLTATVTASSGSPDGSVTFLDGTTTIGVVAVNSNEAVLVDSSLAIGDHSLTAVYTGDAAFITSTSSSIDESITLDATTTSVSPSVNPLTGGGVTFTATVTSPDGSPGGTVTFLDGAKTLGTGNINTSTHQASLLVSSLLVGAHSITAIYTANGSFAGSTSPVLTENSNLNATTTTLAAPSVNPQGVNLPVTFVATVTSANGSPTGTVTLMDGTTAIGFAGIASDGSHKATFNNITFSTGGQHSITAVYSASGSFAGSTSAAVIENIIAGATSTTTLTSSSSSVTIGQNVSFTATVKPSNSGTPTGTVTFVSGNTTLGTAAVNTSGVATLSEYNLYTGSYNVTAIYSGDGNYPQSNSASLSLTISLPASPITSGDGLKKATITAGSGAAAQTGQFIEVNYTGYLFDPGQSDDGSKFDSSLNPGHTPFFFTLGTGVIQGWEEGIPGMQVGETRVLIIPSALAYGPNGSPPSIPGNANLIFVVQMLAVNAARLGVTNITNSSSPVQLMPNQTASAATGTSFGSVTTNTTGATTTLELSLADSTFQLQLTGHDSQNNPLFVQISGAGASSFIVTQPTQANSFQFTITFKPLAKGTQTATITIPTNDTNVPNFTFTVTGVGA